MGETKVGPYTLLRELGRGAMGSVHLALDPRSGTEVAVKLLRAGSDTGDRRARFLREARTAGRIDHPGIVRILEVGLHGDALYIAMDAVTGPTLRSVLERDGSLAPDDALVLVEALARAAHAAHEMGVVHRDLKPENVILGPDGRPRIVDFGIAKDLLDAAQLTATGGVLGTPTYLSPEQAAGSRAVDARTDVWALGVILHEAIAGVPPFTAASPIALFARIASEPPPPLRSPAGMTCARVEPVLLRALAKEPAARFQTALALAEACATARAGLGAAGPRPPRRGAAHLILLATPAVLALGVAGGLLAAGIPTPPSPLPHPTPGSKGPPPPPALPPPPAPRPAAPPPSPNEAAIQHAKVRSQTGDWGGAIDELTAILRKSPDDAAALNGRGMLQLLRGDLDAALSDASRATTLAPDVLDNWMTLAQVQVRLRQPERAIESATRAIAIDPTCAEAFEMRGLLLVRGNLKDYAAAIADIERCIAIDPRVTRFHRNLAHALANSGRDEEAIVQATLAIALDPSDHYGWANRATAREHRNDREGAIADLEVAIEVYPKGPQRPDGLQRDLRRLKAGR